MANLMESTVPELLMKSVGEMNYLWDTSFTLDIYKSMMEGVATYLGRVKNNKEIQVAKLEDQRGLHFAAYVQFIPNENDETKGSYNLGMTFYDDDIKALNETGIPVKSASFSDPILHHIITSIALDTYGIAFSNYTGKEFVIPILCAAADCLKKYSIINVESDSKIELADFFTTEAEKDGNGVYVKITPGPVLKQHVKDDATIEA